MKFSSLLLLLFRLGLLPSHKGNPAPRQDVENEPPEQVFKTYSGNFYESSKDNSDFEQLLAKNEKSENFDERSKDNSVFDQLLAINEKSERSRPGTGPGNKTKFFEGDIILTKSEEEMIENRKRGAATNVKSLIWPIKNGKHEIPYEIDSGISNSGRILGAMKEWTDKVPCLRFVRRTGQKGYLNFFRGVGCSSFVGYQGSKQSISLASGCMHHGIILHEIGHALGLWHEQSRSDRDQYITIHWENIKPGTSHNFDKKPGKTDDKSHGYDYDSIMHYGPKAFSKNGRNTITAKNGHSIGQRQRLSVIDVAQVKTMYTACNGGGGGSANCNFDAGTICSYQNGAGQFNWMVQRGSTPSPDTGPTSDVSRRGYYLYIETSSPRVRGDKATILTPYLNGPQCMKFSYHMYGLNIGSLNIFANNRRIFSKSGNQGNQWVSVQISISQSERYMVKFEGIRGGDYKGDIAIDGINFTPGSCSFQSANCNFDAGTICNYQNGAGQFNWKVQRGSTPSTNTGPTSDVSGRGYYLYIETSSPRVRFDKATILTPYLNGPQCMKFSYHMYGVDIGSLNIFANNKRIFSKSGDQGNQWESVQISISQRKRYMVKFEGIRGVDFKGDIAIDGINFTPGSCSFQSANCNFDTGTICNYQNGAGQFNWMVQGGSTPSRDTGPTSDVSGIGYYLYIETSSPRVRGDKATILTPYLNGQQCMKFSYHMYGADIGSLNIFANNKRIFSKSGNQGNQWMSVQTSIFESGRYMVKFEGTRGGDYEGDIAIDVINFTPELCSVRCNFDLGSFCSFTNRNNNDFDWKIYRGSTPSSGTGPSSDVSGNGDYVYIEASSPRKQGEKADLVSPQVTGVQCVKFYYHMNGADIGSLEVYRDTGSLKNFFCKSGSQGNQWKKAQVQVYGNSYSIVFRGVRGNGYQGDIALDEISVTSGRC